VDVVVKSVPNVPNTDWLEVYYDAKDLTDGAVSTTSGAITGLGGTTNNGTAFGDPQVSNGAFVFDGTGDYIDASVSSTFTGNQMYTFSSWIKPNSHPSGYIGVFGIGTNSTNDSIGLFLDSGTIIHLTYGNNLVTTTYATIGEWVHITGTYDGTGRTIFVNGKLVGTDSYSSLTLAGTTFRLGSNLVGGQNFNGSIANFRLFNRALTTDEIYQLYAYQKEYFGHGVLGMTLKAGRLGIGTSEPRAALDVRGDVHFHNVPHMYAIDSGGYDGANGAYVNFDTVLESYEISLEGSDGTFRITESAGAGIYAVRGSVAFHESNGTEIRNLNIYIHVNNTQINARGYPLTAMKHVTGSTYADLGVSALARCNVGDTIRLYATSGSSSINVHTPNNTMIIYKIQSI
jgi:hypothetical protein